MLSYFSYTSNCCLHLLTRCCPTSHTPRIVVYIYSPDVVLPLIHQQLLFTSIHPDVVLSPIHQQLLFTSTHLMLSYLSSIHQQLLFTSTHLMLSYLPYTSSCCLHRLTRCCPFSHTPATEVYIYAPDVVVPLIHQQLLFTSTHLMLSYLSYTSNCCLHLLT